MNIYHHMMIVISCFLPIVFGNPVYAQIDESRLAWEIIQQERKAIMTEAMRLSEPEAKGFWPLYKEYEAARARLNERTARVTADYVEHHENLSEQKAQAILDEILKIEQEELDLIKAHLEKLRRILPPSKVVRFFQIENSLDAFVNFELVKQVPLVP